MKYQTKLIISGISLVLIFFYVGAQTETPNDWCGGYFRFILGPGSINFTFNYTKMDNINVRNKMCMWTISTDPQYRRVRITDFRLRNLNCTENDVVTISTFKEYQKYANSTSFCQTEKSESSSVSTDSDCQSLQGLPMFMDGPLLVIILKVHKVIEGKGLYLRWVRSPNNEDRIPGNRAINIGYSWGKPNHAPNPYLSYGFGINVLTSLAYLKSNKSDGSNYEMQLKISKVELDPNGPGYCQGPPSFLMLTKIQEDGRLGVLNIFDKNATNPNLIKVGYGFVFVYWSGWKCKAGAGGGRLTFHYTSIQMSPN